jgi:uncharacterized membrane protein
MDAKTTAWVSYLTIVGWIIALVTHNNMNPKSSLATFHIRQSFGLFATGFALYLVFFMLIFIVPFLSVILWLVWIVLFVFWILGLISALNGEEKPLPIVGPLFQQWFQFIK